MTPQERLYQALALHAHYARHSAMLDRGSRELFALFHSNDVEFLVGGGSAVSFHGRRAQDVLGISSMICASKGAKSTRDFGCNQVH